MLYNASTTFPNEHITEKFAALGLVNAFARYSIFPYHPATNKNVAADFMAQFQHIENHDLYLMHKADFCVARSVLSTLDEVACQETGVWFCNFKKFDIREYAMNSQIEAITAESSYLNCLSKTGVNDYTALQSQPDAEAIKTWAVGYEGLDGVMHAYSDAARSFASCGPQELNRSYGFCSIPTALLQNGCRQIVDDRLYAAHIFHEVPGKYWGHCGKDVPGSRY